MTTATLTNHKARVLRPHDRWCAERIRLRELIAAGVDPDVADVLLLHAVAAKIRQCCGHNGLRAHRLAWGWSVREATEQVHALCTAQGLGARGLVTRSWWQWEAGKRPNDDYVDLLCRLFQTSAVHLGYAPDYTPAPTDATASASVAEPTEDPTAEPEAAPVVAEWTGRYAAALRTASRMSARAFAEHLGVAVNTVTYWQARPDRPLSLANQEVLDRAYKLADDDAKARFALLARGMS